VGCLNGIDNQKSLIMKEFALVFRVENTPGLLVSPAEMQQRMTTWMNWMGVLPRRTGWLVMGAGWREGSKWVGAGGVVSDGPYTEVKEFIMGILLCGGRRSG